MRNEDAWLVDYPHVAQLSEFFCIVALEKCAPGCYDRAYARASAHYRAFDQLFHPYIQSAQGTWLRERYADQNAIAYAISGRITADSPATLDSIQNWITAYDADERPYGERRR